MGLFRLQQQASNRLAPIRSKMTTNESRNESTTHWQARYCRIETWPGRELAGAQTRAEFGGRYPHDSLESARELTLIIKPRRHRDVKQRRISMANLLTREFDTQA